MSLKRNLVSVAVAQALAIQVSVANAGTFVVTNTNDSGAGSLREAIEQSNLTIGPDEILFDADLSDQTITLSSDDSYDVFGATAFSVSDDLTIDGIDAPGLRFDGNDERRLFVITDQGDLTISHLTLGGGRARGGDGGLGEGPGGGAAGLGGAIFINEGSLTLEHSTLSGNTARGGNGHAFTTLFTGGGGGGMGEAGSDGAQGSGGAGGGSNGGTPPSGNGGPGGGGAGGQDLANPDGGDGGFGGGGGGGAAYNEVFIFGYGGAGGFGGGGSVGGFGAPDRGGPGGFGGGDGDDDWTYSSGGGGGLGGAIFNNSGTVIATNSTLTGNTAEGGSSPGNPGQGIGGGIFSRNGNLELVHSTISGNTAAQGARSVFILGDGGSAEASISNSILAESDDSLTDFDADTINGGTTMSSGTRNLMRNAPAFQGTIASAADPLLAPLADNGGPTPTHAISEASPAHDAAGNCGGQFGLDSDQRGKLRPESMWSSCDIGAFEFQIVLFQDRFEQ